METEGKIQGGKKAAPSSSKNQPGKGSSISRKLDFAKSISVATPCALVIAVGLLAFSSLETNIIAIYSFMCWLLFVAISYSYFYFHAQ
ncbi:hypothetical protein FJZ26_00855 [Candidatus Parvarchaeota archaeon]|nr:hypothetical protein [Candidatus Parvarchaeota archaeon]